MNLFRLALANSRFPATPEESVALATQAIAEAAVERARHRLLPGMLRPRLPRNGQRAAAS
jgi:hypothetical protein